MSASGRTARLMIASTDHDADMYYATRFFVPDSFIYTSINGRSAIIMSDLEIDRARKQAHVDQVYSFSDLAQKISRLKPKQSPGLLDVTAYFLRSKKMNRIEVPRHFPTAYADRLRMQGFRVFCSEGPFFKQRVIKSEKEVGFIEEAQRHTEAAMRQGIELISKSRIRGSFLYLGSKKLTSEMVRHAIHEVFLERNCLAQHTIVACGEQACDPHQVGSGPLQAHRTIILDIFPRSMKTYYYADMTRTVIKGKPSKELKKLYRTVKEGQNLGQSLIRNGVDGRNIHKAILEYFNAQGYRTGVKNGRMQGFFHGTGHGVGLEIHEPPRIGQAHDILRAGMVVTVEPGLYYPGLGGVRLENMVLVEKRGNRNLTRCPRIFEI